MHEAQPASNVQDDASAVAPLEDRHRGALQPIVEGTTVHEFKDEASLRAVEADGKELVDVWMTDGREVTELSLELLVVPFLLPGSLVENFHCRWVPKHRALEHRAARLRR